jgi:serine/threonine protein kinase
MTLNADLEDWGEPPATPEEEALAAVLDALAERLAGREITLPPVPQPSALTERHEPEALLARDVRRLLAAAASVGEHSGEADSEEGAADPAPPLPDPFPGEFRVERLAGAGAFGSVFLAHDLQLDRPVALKALRTQGPGRARALALLQHEARLLAAVRHANIVQVYACRQAAGEHYLVLQDVAGGSLGARVETGGPLPWHLAARYVADVAEGLRVVHRQGIVHRDVKPANILWDPEKEEALLTDFGVSARLGGENSVGGTPSYMAPEAFAGEVTEALDVYGLAASLFWLMTAEAPFPASTRGDLLRQVRQGLPAPEPRLSVVPEPLEQVLRAGLSASPARRPGLPEFLAGLRGALNVLLADTMLLPTGSTNPPGAAPLRLMVSRQVAGSTYVPVAASEPRPGQVVRDLKRVPPAPVRVRLRTGDRVRVEVETDRPGFLTVFNVGPTGNLNLLYPAGPGDAEVAQPVLGGKPLHVLDAELTPPSGRERLFALWSRTPLSLRLDELLSVAKGGEASGAYRATRDLIRVRRSVLQAAPSDCHTVVLELDHGSSQEPSP